MKLSLLGAMSLALVAGCGGDPISDSDTGSCEEVTCSDRGTCVIQDGQPVCECDTGYAGDDCEECAAGYHDDGTGDCVLDQSCQPNSCSGHGACDDSSGVVACTCDTGYAGEHCEECAMGYQDNDGGGTCEPGCALAMGQGLACGEYSECDDSSGTAVCVCDDGFQDNDGDGDCLPSCSYLEMIGEGCGAHANCDDSGGEAVCICVVGYHRQEDACVWANDRPANPGFVTDEAWTISGDAAIDPSDSGYFDSGAGLLDEDVVCNGGAISQSFEMPALEHAEPLNLKLAMWRKFTDWECMEVHASLEINGGYHLLWTDDVWNWEVFDFCLGERAYGGNLKLELSTKEECDWCGIEDDVPAFKIDKVVISPDSANVCPALGQVRNGDFEEGLVGWDVEIDSTAESLVEASVGEGIWGSTGARLSVSDECGFADVMGRVSVPLAQTMSSPALDFSYRGTADTVAEMKMESHVLGELSGSNHWESVRYCLTEGFKGLVPRFGIGSPFLGGACGTPVTWEYVIDDVTLVSDPACPVDAMLIDGGFENVDSLPSLSHQWWMRSEEDDESSERVVDPAQARTGNVALRLGVTARCASASASTVFTVPAAQGSEGPALKFWYRLPTQINAVFQGHPGNGPLSSSTDWTQATVCLDPSEAGMVRRLVFWAAAYGSCNGTFEEEAIWIDDVEVTTDPSCPQ